MAEGRINWVDYGKGICIILVVMMHSTLNYGDMVQATGWMHEAVTFSSPFRMPDFFLIAGLFLSKSIHDRLPAYIDRKVVHFAYFYILWLAIQTAAFEASLLLSDPGAVALIFAKQLIFPASSLWFIHQLLVFYLVTRLLKDIPVLGVFMGACVLHFAFYTGAIETGWSVTNRFANWYVFFFAGYAFAPMVFRLAAMAARSWETTLAALICWGVWNYEFVSLGWSTLPGVSLAMGFAGAMAVVAVAALMAKADTGGIIRHAGKHSIVIYLTFFLPMKAAQKGLAETGIIPDVGTASFLILVFALGAPLAFHRIIKGTPLMALYERPALFRLRKKPASSVVGSIAEA